MEYEKELQVGVRVVQLACCLCQKIQKGSFGPNPDLVVSKLMILLLLLLVCFFILNANV